jgi:hypothetical protein
MHGTIFILPIVTTRADQGMLRFGNERWALRLCASGPQHERSAYAFTNPMEYFAKLSVAFLGGLDDTLEHVISGFHQSSKANERT